LDWKRTKTAIQKKTRQTGLTGPTGLSDAVSALLFVDIAPVEKNAKRRIFLESKLMEDFFRIPRGNFFMDDRGNLQSATAMTAFRQKQTASWWQ
jgi:hypothetical protein